MLYLTDKLCNCSYLEDGFTVNKEPVKGAILCINTLCASWKARNLSDVTVESLALLDIINPPPGILMVFYHQCCIMLSPVTQLALFVGSWLSLQGGGHAHV